MYRVCLAHSNSINTLFHVQVHMYIECWTWGLMCWLQSCFCHNESVLLGTVDRALMFYYYSCCCLHVSLTAGGKACSQSASPLVLSLMCECFSSHLYWQPLKVVVCRGWQNKLKSPSETDPNKCNELPNKISASATKDCCVSTIDWCWSHALMFSLRWCNGQFKPVNC